MKKILMTLIVLVAMAATASAQTVYISTGDGAVAYHKNKSCSYLTNSKEVKSITTAEAKKLGRHECSRCYGTAAATAKKATTTAKKTTTTAAKKAETTAKKAETTAKKTTTAARDEKGRFIKKADAEKATATKKATTAKKTATEKKTAAEKKATTTKKTATKKAETATKKATTPARDEKGRFIKKADTEQVKKAA